MQVEGFIIGPECSGVTELAKYLKSHRTIQIHPRKSAHYFDYKSGDNVPKGSAPEMKPVRLESYLKSFKAPASKFRVDATDTYFYWPWCANQIMQHNPGARFVVVLREPVERLLHHVQRNQSVSPRKFLHESRELPLALATEQLVRENSLYRYHARYSYTHQNEYLDLMEHLLEEVPEENVLFLDWWAIREQPKRSLDQVCQFFGQAPLDSLPVIDKDPMLWDKKLIAKLVESVGTKIRSSIWRSCASDYSKIGALASINTSCWLHI
jgi:hypothetical protein